MTDKERMEECENQILKSIEKWINSPEMKCNHCGMIFKGDHECDYEYLKEQNKKYREALEFYGNQFNYANRAEVMRKDFGEIARKALEESE